MSGIFFAVEDAPAPDYAPDATPLFSSRRRAQEAGSAVRQVVVETNRSFYCDADAWPLLNTDDHLLGDARIDCLVDPVSGDALFLGDEEPVVLNRAARRSYLKMKKQRR